MASRREDLSHISNQTVPNSIGEALGWPDHNKISGYIVLDGKIGALP